MNCWTIPEYGSLSDRIASSRTMGQRMTLIDVIRNLESLDVEGTIYAAEPWTPNSEVVIESEPTGGGLPPNVEQLKLKYFLEVSIARDLLEGWRANLDAEPTTEQACARWIKYALTDA